MVAGAAGPDRQGRRRQGQPEDAKALAQHLRPQRDRGRQVESRRPRPGRPGGQGRRLRRVATRVHRPAAASSTAPASCWARLRRRRGPRAVARSVSPCCRWMPPSRSRSSSRSPTSELTRSTVVPRVPDRDSLARARRRLAERARPATRSSPSGPPRSCSCAPAAAGPGRGLHAAPGRDDGVRAADDGLPRRRGRPARRRPRSAVGRSDAGRVGGPARRRRGDGAGARGAAVREVFEECGVLLAGPDAPTR